MSSYTYFITDDLGHVKIGVAGNIRNRLSSLQCGNPYPLRLLAAIRWDYQEDAEIAEKILHKHFDNKNCRISGEWFRYIEVYKLLYTDKDIQVSNENGEITFHGFKEVFDQYEYGNGNVWEEDFIADSNDVRIKGQKRGTQELYRWLFCETD